MSIRPTINPASLGHWVARLDQKPALSRVARVDMVSRFDFTIEEGTGFMKISGVGTQVGILEYNRADGMDRDGVLEFVSEATVRASVDGLKGLPITDDHPPEMLDSANTKTYQLGTITDARIDGEGDSLLVRIDATITDAALIEKIKSGKKELSPGYMAHVDGKPGVWNGKRFDETQSARVYNHLAVVDLARAGRTNRFDRLRKSFRCDALGIQNQFSGFGQGNEDLAPVELEGNEFEVPRPIAEELDRLRGMLQQKDADADEEKKARAQEKLKPKPKPKEQSMEDDDKNKNDSVPQAAVLTKDDVTSIVTSVMATQFKSHETRLDTARKDAEARACTISMVKEHLPNSYRFDGKSETDMIFAAIENIDKASAKIAEPHKDKADVLQGIFLGAVANKRTDTGELQLLHNDGADGEKNPIAEAKARQDERTRGKNKAS